MNKKKNKKCIIIGFGRMGEQYLKCLRSLNFSDIEIIDKSIKRLQIAKKKYNIKDENLSHFLYKKIYKKKYYIGIVSTTSDGHKTNVINLAKNRTKFIMVEKPVATSIKDALEMQRVCKKFKSILGVNHQKRFTDEFNKLIKYQIKYKLGSLVSSNLVSANIGLAMNGSHYIELFNFFTKNKINKVSAILENRLVKGIRGKKFVDFAGKISCYNSKNQSLILNISSNQFHGLHIIQTFKMGSIFFDRMNGFARLSSRKKNFFKFPSKFYGLPSRDLIFNFDKSDVFQSTKKSLEKLISNKNFIKSSEAIEVMKVIFAAVQSSSQNGKIVYLNNLKNLSKKINWA